MENLISLTVMAVVVGVLAATIVWLTSILGPKSRSPVKDEPFETGMRPFGIIQTRIPVKFYLVALLFVVFDVELTFLFPWAIVFRELGVTALISMTLFLALLLLTLIYAWKKGVLSWK